jgi:hypothetical protein
MAAKAKVHEITSCEVCGNTDIRLVLDIGEHPLCDDLVAVGDPRVCEEFPIEILLCDKCLTAHQRYQVPKRTLFPTTYHYRSRFTADVLSGMRALTESCVSRFGMLTGKTVVDVGCNDGSLLDFFREQGAITIGIEPTGAAVDAKAKGHTIFQSFLSVEIAEEILRKSGHPRLITFTNVFAHIENLPEVVSSLKQLIGPDTVLVIENHYLGAVLAKDQFDTFYHEHPRTYSCTSFVFIAKLLGLVLIDVEFPSRYGGNIRVYLGNSDSGGSSSIDGVLQAETKFGAKFDLLQNRITVWREAKTRELRDIVARHGRLRAKAFPGRAAILIKLLGIDEGIISAVYEKPGSMKIGHYVPGTRIPIRSDEELFRQHDPAPLLNLAWHISSEIRGYLKDHGYNGPVIDVVSDADFAVAPAALTEG